VPCFAVSYGCFRKEFSFKRFCLTGNRNATFRKDTHVCDGTLVSSHWVLTTASCFQGQAKATWTAVFGNVRIGVTTPWTQKRRIVSLNI
jgi:Trypsin